MISAEDASEFSFPFSSDTRRLGEAPEESQPVTNEQPQKQVQPPQMTLDEEDAIENDEEDDNEPAVPSTPQPQQPLAEYINNILSSSSDEEELPPQTQDAIVSTPTPPVEDEDDVMMVEPSQALRIPPTPQPAPVPSPASRFSFRFDIHEMAKAYFACAEQEARCTAQSLMQKNLHPALDEQEVLALLDLDPTAKISFPVALEPSDYVDRIQEHEKHLIIYSVQPTVLASTIVDRLSSHSVHPYDHFPLMALILQAALPSFKTIKQAGLEKVTDFGDYLDPFNLITKFALVSFKENVVSDHAVAKARALAAEQAAVAANASRTQPKATTSFFKQMLSSKAGPAAQAPAPKPSVTENLTPSITPQMRKASENELIGHLAAFIKDRYPTLIQTVAEYCLKAFDGVVSAKDPSEEGGYRFSEHLIEALVRDQGPCQDKPCGAGLEISEYAMEPLMRDDAPAPACWIPFGNFPPVMRAAIFIYVSLHFYTIMFYTDDEKRDPEVHKEMAKVAGFSPLSFEKICHRLSKSIEQNGENPLVAIFTPEAAVQAPSPDKKRKRSSEEEEAPAAKRTKVKESTTPVKKVTFVEETINNNNKKKGAAKRTGTPKKCTSVDASYFKVINKGNEVAYRPPETVTQATREALTHEPQATRMMISPDKVQVELDAEDDSEAPFALSIDPKKHRPTQGSPHDFTMVFTDPSDNGGDPNRLGTLHVALVAFAGENAEDDDDEEEEDSESAEENNKEANAAEAKEAKPSASDIAMADFGWKNYKCIYSTTGLVTTKEYRHYFNRFVRNIINKELRLATTLSKSMVTLAKYNEAVFQKQGNYNGAAVIIVHTSRAQNTRENAPKVFFPAYKRLPGGKTSIAHLENDASLRLDLKKILFHSERAYKPYTDPVSGAFYRSYVGAHAQQAGDQPRIFFFGNTDRLFLANTQTLPPTAKRFAACCLGCNAPMHMDDYAMTKPVPAFPLIRCAGCSPQFRKLERSGLKSRQIGLCPNHPNRE